MIREHVQHLSLAFGAALFAGAVLAEGATAQEADFLFKRPTVTVGVRLGYAFPRPAS